MIKKKILFVFGTRPEAIKMAPLVCAAKEESTFFDVAVCVSAQHRQMLDQALKVFDIQADFDLNIMKPNQDLYQVTVSVLEGMKNIFREYEPDIVLVHGDTTTTLATSIACFYSRIKVCHIEAGLRTYNINSPYPEEFNRQVASKLMSWHFAPTELNKSNLMAEGISGELITVTGNTVIDSIQLVLKRLDRDVNKRDKVVSEIDRNIPFDWRTKKFILITGHRRENFGKGFLELCEALRELAVSFKEIQFVYPVHLNPNVADPVHSILGGFSNIHLLKPLDYEPFVYLLKHAFFVLTDSGGIQEEAPSLGKPVLVFRELTERTEAVTSGVAKLVGAQRSSIVSAVTDLLSNDHSYLSMVNGNSPYGDGRACEKILSVLKTI